MRSHHGVRMLAALAAGAGITAPAAQAKFDNTTYPPLNAQLSLPAHHPGGSTDWMLIGVGAAGGLTLLGAGATTSRRRTAPATKVRTASGS
jgi:hypothetical protein